MPIAREEDGVDASLLGHIIDAQVRYRYRTVRREGRKWVQATDPYQAVRDRVTGHANRRSSKEMLRIGAIATRMRSQGLHRRSSNPKGRERELS
jgi:hypothetical protein